MISVENLGKKYYIGVKSSLTNQTFVGTISRGIRRLVDSRLARSGSNEIEELWALKNVSFSLQQGEVLGIIGENGSGKSTLLKVLSRITAPTEGKVIMRGRVGSLLEVGIGFQPELTGRDNIYLSGAIQGMKRAEINKIFEEIVDFSGVEHFIDTPVRYYSSGMYVRLAFAVASFLNPEILILDEVLSVGDAAFQRKSMARMEKIAKSGKTVLFVSHAMLAVSRLCEKALYLEHGKALYYGDATDVIGKYMRQIHQIDENRLREEGLNYQKLYYRELINSNKRWEGYSAKILTWVSCHRLDGTPSIEFITGDSMVIRIGYRFEKETLAYCNINFLNYMGVQVMTLKSINSVQKLKLKGSGVLECVIHDLRLASGEYILMLAIGNFTENIPTWMDCISDTVRIKVSMGNYLGGYELGEFESTFAQQSEWTFSSE